MPDNPRRAIRMSSYTKIPKRLLSFRFEKEEGSSTSRTAGTALVVEGRRTQFDEVTHFLTTDPVDAGWGAHLKEAFLTGRWLMYQRSWYTNIKLFAVYGAISAH